MSEELPIILVSAANTSTANAVITDIINNEVANDDSGEGMSEEHIWLVANKYYTARVRLVGLGEEEAAAEAPAAAARAQAHVVHLGADELSAGALQRRAARASPACHVRLALCQLSVAAPAPPADLLATARALRYELVPLPSSAPAPPPPVPAEPFPELQGVARAREALHAHPWPGLRLHAPDAGPWRGYDGSSDSSEGEDDEAPETSEAECARQAELFAEALGALEAARDLRQEALDEPERRLRADQLLRAFAAALGTDIDGL